MPDATAAQKKAAKKKLRERMPPPSIIKEMQNTFDITSPSLSGDSFFRALDKLFPNQNSSSRTGRKRK